MENNVINLADHRPKKDPLKTIFEDQEIPSFLAESFAKAQAAEELLLNEHNYLASIAHSFKPCATPALENPLLIPLFDIAFNTKKLRDVFYPPRKMLAARDYDAMDRKLGITFYIDYSNPFDIYINFNKHGVERIRKAYAKKGLNWIDCIVASAVELQVDDKPPAFGLKNGNRAMLQIASAN